MLEYVPGRMMRARTGSKAAGVLLVLGASAGCVREYRAPTVNEPHAVVKFRRVYEKRAGSSLREMIKVEGGVAFVATSESMAAVDPRTNAVLVHPRPAILNVGNVFFHVEMRQVREYYTVQVPYSDTETYSCGYSSGGYSSTCTRTVTKYRSEQRERWVTEAVQVPDGRCAQELAFAPRLGGSYLVQFTYQDDGICQASCYEQIPTPGADGEFQNRPCPEPTAGEMAELRRR